MQRCRILKIDSDNPKPRIIKKTAQIIQNGGVVAYPTDTCYGLGADFKNSKAIEKLVEIKSRPKNKKFSVIMKDIKMIKRYCKASKEQEKFLKIHLPGPYTFILESATNNETFAVRIPNCKITKALSEILNKPYTATSCNKKDEPPCYDVKCIVKNLTDIDLILDAGELPKNPPSKIIDLTISPPRILRD